MKKTDKKIDKVLRETLNEVCEIALEHINGFKWITHFVNYPDFPKSLSIVCVFDTNADLLNALSTHKDDYLLHLIKNKLNASGIPIKDTGKHVSFDTEEACKAEHNGKWGERFNRFL